MKTEYIKMIQASKGMRMGEKLPGFGGWLDGFVTIINDEGDINVDFDVREEMLNPMGGIHGGAVAAIIDEILGFQVFLKSAEDAAYVSISMSIDFLRPARGGEVITAIPTVVRIGRKIANVTCVLNNAEGKRIAQGSANFMRVM